MATGWAPEPNGSILPSPMDTHLWLADGSRVWSVLCFMAFIIESHKHRTRTLRLASVGRISFGQVFFSHNSSVCVRVFVWWRWCRRWKKAYVKITLLAVAAHKLTVPPQAHQPPGVSIDHMRNNRTVSGSGKTSKKKRKHSHTRAGFVSSPKKSDYRKLFPRFPVAPPLQNALSIHDLWCVARSFTHQNRHVSSPRSRTTQTRPERAASSAARFRSLTFGRTCLYATPGSSSDGGWFRFAFPYPSLSINLPSVP